MQTSTTAAIAVYHGVLVDEAAVFRFVLSRIPGVNVLTVGAMQGRYIGPGGVEVATAALGEVSAPEIVAVPGGLGCHRRTEIAAWLRSISPAWVLTSSTGSALLATTGLLHDTAATHWLAGSLLERHGIRPSDQQMIIDGGIITSSGRTSAFRAALVVAKAYGGPDLASRIEDDAGAVRETPAAPGNQSRWRRLSSVIRSPLGRPNAEATEPKDVIDQDVLDLGLIVPPQRDRRTRYAPASSAVARSLAV